MTAKQWALQERRALKSAQNQAKGLLPPAQGSVPMAVYLAALDEKNDWRKRALDAEARLCGSGDILGEGKFHCGTGQGGFSDNRSY